MNGKRFAAIKERFEQLSNKRRLLEQELQQVQEDKRRLKCRLADLKKAKEVVNLVAHEVQAELEGFIGEVVTQALEAVFSDPYRFVLVFAQKYGKTHCNVFLQKGEALLDPMDNTGGGPKDVVAFAARVAFVRLRGNRPLIIADEPFKFLHSVDYQRACSDMVTTLAKDAGFQFVIVSDQADIQGDNVIDLEVRYDKA